MSANPPLWVYVTAESPEEARRIGRAVVGEKLAACANVLDGMTAIFEWQGEVREGSESVLILKSRHGRLAALTERIAALHSYDCPCIVALPMVGGHPPFLDWIAGETAEPAKP